MIDICTRTRLRLPEPAATGKGAKDFTRQGYLAKQLKEIADRSIGNLPANFNQSAPAGKRSGAKIEQANIPKQRRTAPASSSSSSFSPRLATEQEPGAADVDYRKALPAGVDSALLPERHLQPNRSRISKPERAAKTAAVARLLGAKPV